MRTSPNLVFDADADNVGTYGEAGGVFQLGNGSAGSLQDTKEAEVPLLHNQR